VQEQQSTAQAGNARVPTNNEFMYTCTMAHISKDNSSPVQEQQSTAQAGNARVPTNNELKKNRCIFR
jgi:hypothetical protein